jgi:hypothetical protein
MTQGEKLLRLLEENVGHWVDLPRILELRIAQYSARVFELRRKGYRIENRVLHSNGGVRSSFRLLPPQPAQGELELGLCGRGRGVV